MLEVGYTSAPYHEPAGLFGSREQPYSTFDVGGDPSDLRRLLGVVTSVANDGGVEQVEAQTPDGAPAVVLVVRTRHSFTAAALDRGVLLAGDAAALAELAGGIERCILGWATGPDGYHVHMEAEGGETGGIPAADFRVYIAVESRTHNPPL